MAKQLDKLTPEDIALIREYIKPPPRPGVPKVIAREDGLTTFKYCNGLVRIVADCALSANERKALKRIGATLYDETT